ncbi:MAG: glycosyltransferase family 4 protein [bacterium]|nr:glycosyltransferase family 4 protein [bacterium]
MNVMFLDSIEKETYGGMEEWVRLVASGLVAKGHRVRVVGRPGSRFLDRIERDTENVQITGLDISGDFHPRTIGALKSLMAEDQTEIVVTNFNKDLRLGGLAAKLDGNPRVVWSVGLDITRDSWIHRLLTPRLFDGVLVPSNSLKSQITRHGYIDPNLVEVIPIGIPEILPAADAKERSVFRQKNGIPGDAIVGVTLGRFVEQKGHRYLIEALATLAARYPNLYLIWCGDGPLLTELQEIAAKLQVEKQIIFAGMLTDIVPALEASDLMVHPSIEEPFGIAVLEGMRSGLSVVASNVGGIPEVLGDAGLLVKAGDPEAFAEGISGLLESKETRSQLGARARQRFVEQFSLEAMLGRIEGYFQAMLQAERRHG